MMHVVQWSLSDIEELEKMETEKTIKVDILRFEMPLIYSSSNIGKPSVFIVDWSIIPPISSFSLKLFADLRISNIIETPSDI